LNGRALAILPDSNFDLFLVFLSFSSFLISHFSSEVFSDILPVPYLREKCKYGNGTTDDDPERGSPASETQAPGLTRTVHGSKMISVRICSLNVLFKS
jgi:hypothetical protein